MGQACSSTCSGWASPEHFWRPEWHPSSSVSLAAVWMITIPSVPSQTNKTALKGLFAEILQCSSQCQLPELLRSTGFAILFGSSVQQVLSDRTLGFHLYLLSMFGFEGSGLCIGLAHCHTAQPSALCARIRRFPHLPRDSEDSGKSPGEFCEAAPKLRSKVVNIYKYT